MLLKLRMLVRLNGYVLPLAISVSLSTLNQADLTLLFHVSSSGHQLNQQAFW
jgi:hypothetical protein